MLEFYQIYYGIILVLAIQSTFIALINLFNGTSTNRWFCFFVLLFVHSAIRTTLAYPILEANIYWWVLILTTAQFYGPVLYLFLVSQIEPIGIKRIVIHFFIPFVYFLTLLAHGFHPDFNNHHNYKYYSMVMNSVLAVLTSGYYVAGLLKLKSDNWMRILNSVSKKIKSFYLFVGTYLVYTSLFIVFEIMTGSYISEHTRINIGYIDSILYLIIFLALPFYGFSLSPIFKKIIQPYKTIVESNENVALIMKKIDILITEEEIYRQSNLTINSFASEINTPRNDLTLILNNEYHSTFNDFINNARVESIKKDLRSSKFTDYDLLSLAKEHGFSSKSTFFRVFKNFTGMTPNQFKESNQPSSNSKS